MNQNEKKYYAFISYRHADNIESGRQWATWLHQSIETYQVPEDLVGKTNSRGETIPERIFPVFRDEEALPADADLSNVITRALDNTNFLIVLCSPRARASTFVAEEIRYFKRLGRSDRIIAAMIDGEPNTSLDGGKIKLGFKAEDECFPEPLQFVFDKGGKQTTERTEPVAADFRVTLNHVDEQGWTTPQALKEYLEDRQFDKESITHIVSNYDKQLKLMLLKVIAGIIGVPLDDLTQRDKTYQLELEKKRAKRLRQWLSAVATLAVVAIAAGIFANEQRELAIQERNQALTTQSLFLADLAQEQIAKGNYDTALLLALNAVPGEYGGVRPSVIEAAEALSVASHYQDKFAVLTQRDEIERVALSENQALIATASLRLEESEISIWSTKTGEQRHSIRLTMDNWSELAFSKSGKTLLADTNLYSVETGELITVIPVAFSYRPTLSPCKRFITGDSEDGTTLFIWSSDTGELLHSLNHQTKIKALSFSEESDTLATFTRGGTFHIWSLNNGQELQSIEKFSEPSEIYKFGISQFLHFSISPDGQHLYIRNTDISLLWSLDDNRALNTISDQSKFEELTSFLTTEKEKLWLFNQWLRSSINNKGVKLLKSDYHKALFIKTDAAVSVFAIDGTLIKKIEPDEPVMDFGLSPNGNMLVTTSSSGEIIVWDVKTFEPLQHFKSDVPLSFFYGIDNPMGFETSYFSSDNQKIATINNEGSVTLWSIGGSKVFSQKKLDGTVKSVNFGSGNSVLAVAYDSRFVDLFSINNGTLLNRIEYIHNNVGFAIEVYVDPSQKYIAIESMGSLEIRSFDSGEIVQRFSLGYNSGITAVNFIEGTEKIAIKMDRRSYLGNQFIDICSIKNGDCTHRISGEFEYSGQSYSKLIEHVLFSKNNKNVAIEYGTDKRFVVVYSVESGSIRQLFKVDNNVRLVSFSPDDKYVFWDSESGDSEVWSIESGKKIQSMEEVDGEEVLYRLEAGGHYSMFSQNSKFLILSQENSVLVKSIYTRGTLLEIETPGQVRKVVLSSDDQFIAVEDEFTLSVYKISYNTDAHLVRSKLPKNRTCLSPKEREIFFLPKLCKTQWELRDCEHYITQSEEC
ncbi:TIR domain-containing protein [Alteromonas sp. ASW11-36]|uniref:TIR domain-containing protein n=1 Tax=Alteromonas arenosi TaxID=3055817 RepID=A0ABT7SZ23_9ALTE|nr:TIR domain-containing protein [Alteromonas sp. ASW11-36]MDM7861259.1 TIR domain-containing protein [Alteromonas sp. ASW11-36]